MRKLKNLTASPPTDRLRGQLVTVDRTPPTGTLEAVEDAGSQVRRSFWGPVHKASAIVQGIKNGLDVLRSRRSSSDLPPPKTPSNKKRPVAPDHVVAGTSDTATASVTKCTGCNFQLQPVSLHSFSA